VGFTTGNEVDRATQSEVQGWRERKGSDSGKGNWVLDRGASGVVWCGMMNARGGCGIDT